MDSWATSIATIRIRLGQDNGGCDHSRPTTSGHLYLSGFVGNDASPEREPRASGPASYTISESPVSQLH